MKNKTLYEILYASDKNFILKYFKILDDINLNYCEELKTKKILSNNEYLKIKQHSKKLNRKKFKNLLKKNYLRGYYFEFEKSYEKECGINIAGKMHVGRSRNELDSCISRIMMRDNLIYFSENLIKIIKTIVDRFSENSNYFPYFTQNQPASFVKINHYFNNILLSLYEYLEKILSERSSIYSSPLGSCGLNGSDFNLNYKKISKKLKFKDMEKNSIKSVSDYEYLIYYINLANIIVTKLSRMFHDFIFFQSYEINFIKISNKYSGRSSYFPHKSNPYLIEKCLSLSNELINYNNLISNGLRKTINSNSFEFKNLIFQSYAFFDKFNDFSEISIKILKNITFNKDLSDNKNYEFLYLTSIQNQITRLNTKINIRSLNKELNKIYRKRNNLDDVIFYLNKNYSKILKNLKINQIKNNKKKYNNFGYGSNDKKALFTKNYHFKIIRFFLKIC